jgi:hypothetical protein
VAEEPLSERVEREEQAERVRDAFRQLPGFVETLRQSQEDEREGRLIPLDDVKREWGVED